MNDDKHLRGYERMLERVRDASHEGMVDLHKRLDKARDAAVHLGELTQEESELIQSYVRRDLELAGQFLDKGSHAFAEWLDIDLDAVWSWLTQAADKTELAWLQLAAGAPMQALDSHDYRSGEICGMGTLRCQNCDQRLHFARPSVVPACPNCHKTLFSRLPAA